MAIYVKNHKFPHPLYLTSPLREFRLEFCNSGSARKISHSLYTRWWKEFDDMCIRFDTTWTDRRICHNNIALCMHNKLCGKPPQYASALDLLTLKVVSELHVMWATSVPILVFLGLCSRLRPDVRDIRQTDRRQTDVRQHHRLMPPPYGGGCIIMHFTYR